MNENKVKQLQASARRKTEAQFEFDKTKLRSSVDRAVRATNGGIHLEKCE